ncbi:MAG: hypothetical protein PGN34_24880 [Methylobacterium frigidaeris]
MARALNLIHGCAGLLHEGWPPLGLTWRWLVVEAGNVRTVAR